MGTDRFSQKEVGLQDPADEAFAIIPHDSTDFDEYTRAIYVGGIGDVVVVMASGSVVEFTGVPAGAILPVRAIRVNDTNTTATDLVGLI